MQTSIKNLVKTSDYSTFLLRQHVIWNNLKHQLTEDLNHFNQYENKSNYLSSWFNKNKQTYPTIREDLLQKLTVVQQRLELIHSEYNRLQYYTVYRHEQIELPSELSNAFFEFAVQEIKSGLTFH